MKSNVKHILTLVAFLLVGVSGVKAQVDGYHTIKNSGNNKYLNVAGRKSVTVVDATADKAGTTIRVKSNSESQQEVLRSRVVGIPLQQGNVVDDGVVDLNDVLAIVDIILGKAVEGDEHNYDFVAANVDGDENGSITISDVVALIKIIIKSNQQPPTITITGKDRSDDTYGEEEDW